MKMSKMTSISTAILLALSSSAALAEKGGKGGGKDEGPGPDDPVFSVESVR